jgi:hypothetical protein
MSIDGQTGKLSWVPTRGQGGTHPVTIEVSDGLASATQSFKVNVIVPNTAPTVTLLSPEPDSRMTGSSVTLNWSSVDKEGDAVLFDVYLGKNEVAVTSLDPRFRVASQIKEQTYTTSVTGGSTYYWTVIPTDPFDTGDCVDHIRSFAVAGQNHEPVFKNEPVTVGVIGVTYGYGVEVVDEDGDILEYSLPEGPDGMTIDPATGLITWTPGKDQIGDHEVVIEVSDGTVQLQQRFSVAVKAALSMNNKPVIKNLPDATIRVGTPFELVIKATDADPGDVLRFSIVSGPTGMSITPDGRLAWTPKSDQVGSHNVTVKVTDGKDDAQTTFHVQVTGEDIGPSDDGGSAGSSLATPVLALILLVVIAAVIIIAVLVSRRGKGGV